jgi:hypothetical protein
MHVTHMGNDKCIKNVNQKTLMEETTWETGIDGGCDQNVS